VYIRWCASEREIGDRVGRKDGIELTKKINIIKERGV
jgi:hypothetical protein